MEPSSERHGHHSSSSNRIGNFPLDSDCEVSPSCLNCPLLMCKHDDPLWYKDWKRQQKKHLAQAKVSEKNDSSLTNIL